MIIKTCELIEWGLDWAVAQAEGKSDVKVGRGQCYTTHPCERQGYEEYRAYRPSTDWAQGGPLIERYDATIVGASFCKDGEWGRNLIACVGKSKTRSGEPVRAAAYQDRGEGHLVAFMRAIVAAELGDELDMPDEVAQSGGWYE